jgi:dTDP-4-dehydrorhamnose reductase
MKILITGVQGLLGHEVAQVCKEQGDETIETDIIPQGMSLDITNPGAIRDALSSIKPEWLINCAAYTNVDGCENNQQTAFELNAQAPGHLARACEEYGTKLLHVSTDYVFNGGKRGSYTEDDETEPLSIYGKSKLAGEKSVQEGIEHYIIVRTQWLFGPHGKNFVSTILKIAKEKTKINVVNDQWGSPTYSNDLAKAIRLLVGCNAQGIYHVCNRGHATWFDLAKKTLEIFELSTEILPVGTKDYPLPAHRPANSKLSTKRFTETTGRVMPPWQISLRKYIKEYLMEARSSGLM